MENSQLTISDLASIRSLIDAACSRGAFKAAEMATVGHLYDKLSRFLDQISASTEEMPNNPQGDNNA
jgi:hypothetical protein